MHSMKVILMALVINVEWQDQAFQDSDNEIGTLEE
jgi:hypothetical protein